jgi:hypothetical protein
MTTTTHPGTKVTTRGPSRSLARRVTATALALGTAGGLALAGAPAASAAGPSYLLRYGDSADFPTWFWGATRLCVDNLGSSYGEAQVQTRLGAPPEWIPVQPGTTRCISRWWGGVPITVTNVSNSPLRATSS